MHARCVWDRCTGQGSIARPIPCAFNFVLQTLKRCRWVESPGQSLWVLHYSRFCLSSLIGLCILLPCPQWRVLPRQQQQQIQHAPNRKNRRKQTPAMCACAGQCRGGQLQMHSHPASTPTAYLPGRLALISARTYVVAILSTPTPHY